MKVDLTPAQASAAVAALDSYLLAGTEDECVAIFGSPQGTGAAARAKEKLVTVAMPLYRKQLGGEKDGE